jgi:hypothetical protein
MKELKAIQSDCQSLIQGDPLDALTQQQSLEADVGKLRERLSDISLQPLIKPWMRAKEEGACDTALENLVSNFKLSYDTDSVGADREGEDGMEDQSGNESDSSVDSLMGESGGLSDVLEVYRLRSLANQRTVHSSIDSAQDTREPADNQVYSQETQAMATNFTPALRVQRSEHTPTGHWLSNPPSASNFSLFNQRLMHGRASLTRVLDDSGSNSDPDDPPPRLDMPPGYLRPYRRRGDRHQTGATGDSDDSKTAELGSEDSDREIEEILERHQSQSHELGMGASGGAGVESMLDSLEIRRHWDFLNSRRGRVRVGEQAAEEEDSSKDEEEEPHTLSELLGTGCIK